MHFITFVAVKIDGYTICKETDNEIKKQIELLSQRKPNSVYEKVSLKCCIGELKSLTNSFARAVNVAVESKLEPYCECAEDKRYLKFFDETENIEQEYESGEDCIKLSNGTVQSAYKMYNEFYIKDGFVYQKNFGPLKQDKRSKRAKKCLHCRNIHLRNGIRLLKNLPRSIAV